MENKEVEKQCEAAAKQCPNHDLRIFFISLLAAIIVVAAYHLTRMVVRHYRLRRVPRITCPCRQHRPMKFHKGKFGKPGKPCPPAKCAPGKCAPAKCAPVKCAPAKCAPAPAPAPAPAKPAAPAPAPAPAK